MVKVGEEAGVLDDILNRLSSLLEHDAMTRARVKAATRYPVIVVISMIIAFLCSQHLLSRNLLRYINLQK